MTDRAALLAAIAAAPDDDTPRLVFADWLEEHGERLRAEVIRAQCAVAVAPACLTPAAPGSPTGCRDHRPRNAPVRLPWCAARKRHADQWRHYGRLLDGLETRADRAAAFGLPPDCIVVHEDVPARFPDEKDLKCAVSRGLVTVARGRIAVLREHLPRIVAEHPGVQPITTDVSFLCSRSRRHFPYASFLRPNDLGRLPVSLAVLKHLDGPQAERVGAVRVLNALLLDEARAAQVV